MEKIISVVFKVESEAYQALTELKNKPAAENYIISEGALVKKEDGRVILLDSFDTGIETSNDTLAGGLIGGFIGILGGPLGVLLGYSLGAMTGSMVDTDDAVYNISILEKVTEQFVDGEVAVIALVQENEEGIIRDLLSKFDTVYVEEDAAEVAEEVRYAAEVQRQLEKEAKKLLREEKKEDRKQKVAERRAGIKDHFAEIKEKRAAKKADKDAAAE